MQRHKLITTIKVVTGGKKEKLSWFFSANRIDNYKRLIGVLSANIIDNYNRGGKKETEGKKNPKESTEQVKK